LAFYPATGANHEMIICPDLQSCKEFYIRRRLAL